MIEPIFFVGQIVPFFLLLIAISFILFLFTMRSEGGFNFQKFYYTIVSFASIAGMTIAFGIVLYQIAIGRLISNDEYINGRSGGRELQQCSDPYYRSVPVPFEEGEVPEAKTALEIAECEAKEKQRLIIQRSYNKKQSMIGGLIRGIIFRALYMTHYPRMEGFTGSWKESLFGSNSNSGDTPAPAKKKTPAKRKAPTRKKATPKKTPVKKKTATKKKK